MLIMAWQFSLGAPGKKHRAADIGRRATQAAELASVTWRIIPEGMQWFLCPVQPFGQRVQVTGFVWTWFSVVCWDPPPLELTHIYKSCWGSPLPLPRSVLLNHIVWDAQHPSQEPHSWVLPRDTLSSAGCGLWDSSKDAPKHCSHPTK